MSGRRLRRIGECLLLLVLLTGLAQAQKRDLVIWGMSYGTDSKGLEAVNKEFERRHPDIHLKVLSMGAGQMSAQKLLTSIVGDVAPDVVLQDRFTVADWASRGAFTPLDDFIKRDLGKDPLCPRQEDYYPAVWKEATFDGKVYGIPQEADNRALYWNKAMFRDKAAELRAAGLDPNRPPRTWSEVLRYSKVLTEFNKNGTLKLAGFMPNYGNVWLYMYAFQNDAEFMSPDGRTCTLDTPASEEALSFVVKGYDQLGGYEVARAFESSFLSHENSPFYIGKIAMYVNGDWVLNDLSRYAPQLDFAVAPPPVPDDRYNHTGRFKNDKDTYITWAGGFCLVIPKGARHPEDAWTYIKFAGSVEGHLIECRAQAAWERSRGRAFIPKQYGNRKVNELIFKEFKPADPKFAAALRQHIDLMPAARIRPNTFVGQALWDAHVRAMDQACYHKLSPHDALMAGQEIVQKDLDNYYNQDNYPVIEQAYVVYGFTGLGVIACVLLWVLYRRLRLARLARHEARWGYLFVSPWVVGFVALTLGPMLVSLFWSFTQYSALSPPRWVGVKNYADMVTIDKANMFKAFFNTTYLAAFGVPLSILTGLAIALLLNTAVRGMRFYRTFFYMPSIVSGVGSAILWAWVLMPDPTKGLLNSAWVATLTKWMGLPPPGWMAAEPWAKHTLILMGMWGAGSGMILWLAGLKGIPTTLYEASSIDGATPWQQFWKVTAPQLSPVIFFMTVMGFIGSLQEFDRVFILKGPDGPIGPADSLLTPVYRLFDVAFGQFKMGYASAIAWIVFVLIVLITVVQFWIAPRWVHYEADI
ncbi:MAG TPA: extracellular solute-binding protein [Fimbriimonadaceae bacterium]|nr:extracellular solute-binding protein [Fimbriimonadaceae bacterium]